MKSTMTLTNFRKELQRSEKTLLDAIILRTTENSTRIENHKDHFEKTFLSLDKKIDVIKSEVLWRIQDAEELIKSRISEKKV